MLSLRGHERDRVARQQLKRCHLGVVEVAPIYDHVLDLALERLNDGVREVDVLELLGAAEPTWAKDVDLHELVADDVDADEEHTVLNELRAYVLGHAHVC